MRWYPRRLRLAAASRPLRPDPLAAGLIAALILSVAGPLPIAPGPARADDGDSPRMCWRGRPWPYCRDFWITETGVGYRLSRSGNPQREDSAHRGSVILELGHMFNLRNRSALGASISYHGSLEPRLTLHPRYRYWIDRRWALDVAGGVVVAAGIASGYEFKLPGYVARGGISYGDWVAVNTGVEFMPLRDGGTDVNWLVDSRLAGYLGGSTGAVLVTAGALLVALLVATWSND